MIAATTKAKLEFAWAMGRYTTFAWAMGRYTTATQWDIQQLLRLGATINAIATRQRNGYANTDWGRAQESRDKRKADSTRKRIAGIAKGFDAGVRVSGDPRGCTVKLVLANGYSNDFGGEGLCVPTS